MFTTNYDLAVEWAAESIGLHVTNGFGGIHNRRFAPHHFDLALRNTLARGEARFGTYSVYLAKLHGSLSWRHLRAEAVVEEPAASCWPRLRKFLEGGRSDHELHVVFPSAAKYIQTVGFVLGELLRRLAEVLARPQSAMITVGYSFSDDHLNRLLLTALQNPTLQLVVYCPSFRREGERGVLRRPSAWMEQLVALESPQVTVVGGGTHAYMRPFTEFLPEPALFDEQAARVRDLLMEFRKPPEGGADGG